MQTKLLKENYISYLPPPPTLYVKPPHPDLTCCKFDIILILSSSIKKIAALTDGYPKNSGLRLWIGRKFYTICHENTFYHSFFLLNWEMGIIIINTMRHSFKFIILNFMRTTVIIYLTNIFYIFAPFPTHCPRFS